MMLILSCSSHDLEENPSSPPFKIDNVIFLTQKQDLSALLKQDIDIQVVCFTSQTCKACKPYSKTFQKTAKTYEHREDIRFVYFDISFDDSVPESYDIEIVPTTLIIKNEETVKTMTGPGTRDGLIKSIQQVLESP